MLNKIKIDNSPYTLIHNDILPEEVQKKVCEQKKAKYLGEFSLRTKEGDWSDFPVAIFYQEEAHPEGSNYFGIYKSPLPWQSYMITNAIKATEVDWTGVLNPDTNDVLYSAYQHDYQTLGSLMADGGHCYTRCSNHPIISFKIFKDKIILVEDKENANNKSKYGEDTTSN